MRKFSGEGSRCLTEVLCNCCGRKIRIKNGIPEEECIRMEIPFGYFSKKDGQTQRFDLCEDCYDNMTANFRIPVEIEEATELI